MNKNKANSIDSTDNSSKDNMMIVDIVSIIFHNRKWFILSIVISLLIGLLYIKITPKTYLRTATILVKDEKKGGIMGEAAAFNDIFSSGGNSVDNEIGFFKSKRLMHRVVKQLQLDMSYKERNGLYKKDLYTLTPFTVTFPDAADGQQIALTATMLDENRVKLTDIIVDEIEFEKEVVAMVGDTVETPGGKIVVKQTPSMDKTRIGSPIYIEKKSTKAVTNDYNFRLNVAVVNKQSSLINLSIKDKNIRRAEDVLNTLISVYEDDAVEEKNKVMVNTLTFIKNRLAIIEADLGNVDAQIENYKKTNRLTDITSENALFLESSSRLDIEGLSVDNQLNMAEYMKEYLQNNTKVADLIPASIGINDNGIQNQINEYNSVVTKRNKLIANSSVNNPIVQDMDASLKSMRLSVLKAVENMITGLKIQVTNMQNKELGNRSKISDVPTQQKFVMSVERQQKIKEELYLYLLNKQEESELQLSINESNCRIVDPADGSEIPVSPNIMNIILLCLALGFMIPAIWIYVKLLIDTRIYFKKEVKDGVDIPFLGDIPLEKRKYEQDIVVREGSRDGICEAFRILRDNLEFMNMNTDKKLGGKVIQLTSINPNSGKTFICINLAMSMALSNIKVIVLDLDLRKGSLTKKLGISTKEPGISGYLSGKVENMKSVIHSFPDHKKLDIITSGILPPNPAELLKSDKLDQLIAELRKEYDYILLDNPPFGVVVDASLCARVADQTIYIIRSGLFDKRQLPELQELYDSGKLKNMSIILNGIDCTKNGYGYGYGYGYGNEEEMRNKKKSLFKKIFGI